MYIFYAAHGNNLNNFKIVENAKGNINTPRAYPGKDDISSATGKPFMDREPGTARSR
jgi:hypothetical protein